ncbi:unnamed protein product, partial [Rotaria sp. Silwood2]
MQSDVFTIHYNPYLWDPEDPNLYKSERHEVKRHHVAWMSFGVGPINSRKKYHSLPPKMSLEATLKQWMLQITSPENANRLSSSIGRILSSPSPLRELDKAASNTISNVKSVMRNDFSRSSHLGQQIANGVSLVTEKMGLGKTIALCLSEIIKENRSKACDEDCQPILVVWLINPLTKEHNNMELYNTVDSLGIFYEDDQCVDYILSKDSHRVFLILSCSHMNTIPIIWQIPQLLCIYVLCEDPINHEHDSNQQNVNIIYNDENSLMKQLDDDINLHSNVDNTLPMRMLSKSSNEKSCRDLSDEHTSFIWFQLLIEMLICMPDTDDAKTEMINECRLCYKNNNSELKKIESFEKTYCLENTIDWYTKDSFVYRLLNKALRTENIDIIFKFRFFIKYLHHNLISLHEDFIRLLPSPKFTAFRGQHLSSIELKMLLNNIGGFISMNSFLSTTLVRNLALPFAGDGSSSPSFESVLFQIECDISKRNKPFGSTNTSESEVLFAIGTVFRIENIGKLEDNNKVWLINLVLEDNNENERYMKELIASNMTMINTYPTVESIAKVLSSMGECEKARKYFEMTLQKIPSNDVCKIAHITACIGDCEK